MFHDGNIGKTYKARVVMVRALRGYVRPIHGRLHFPSFILVETLAPAKFPGMVTALLSCIMPRGSLFPHVN